MHHGLRRKKEGRIDLRRKIENNHPHIIAEAQDPRHPKLSETEKQPKVSGRYQGQLVGDTRDRY
jgi:hypothetical protein